MSNNQGMDANRRLALALGWTNITEAGGALLGMPPWAAPNSRGQAAVPNWAGDWRECGPLMAEHKCIPCHSPDGRSVQAFVRAEVRHGVYSPLHVASCDIEPGHSADAATRLAIVQAVCAKLEAGQ